MTVTEICMPVVGCPKGRTRNQPSGDVKGSFAMVPLGLCVEGVGPGEWSWKATPELSLLGIRDWVVCLSTEIVQ